MKYLDFIIIGAQKSATTSLFRYMQKHPGIFMPPDKEAPFFSRESLYSAGWPEFAASYFQNAGSDALWGTATPQYMGNPDAPARISGLMKEVKLIAILRNPIDRAYSHYIMSVRRNMEKRPFDQAVDDLLKSEALTFGRNLTPPDHVEGYDPEKDADIHTYIVWGEYGRILEKYLDFFPAKQLLVLFMDDLQKEPEKTLDIVFDFLGLETGYRPPNLGKTYHKGGSRQRFSDEWKNKIKTNTLFRSVWDQVPERTKQLIRYWYDQMNVRKEKEKQGPDPVTRHKLAMHFQPDIKKLEDLTGLTVPWEEFRK